MNKKTRSVVLAGAVENTNEGFITIDEDHKVIFFNRAAEKIFGYTREEVIGKDLDAILAPQCARDHRHAVGQYLRSKSPRVIGHAKELVATRKTGETFPCSISFSKALFDGRLFFTGVVQDLTETKALQEQIDHSERLAMLGQIVAEVSHEIKNPLTVIGGFVRQLLRRETDEKTKSKLHIIASEVQRLEQLMEDLRGIYLPRTIQPKRFNMNDLLHEVYAMMKEACSGNNIQLTLTTGENPAPVNGDKEKLKQVFVNLLKNSMEALNQKGTISIRSVSTSDIVELVIADDGPGIPEALQEKIFEPFMTTKQEGSGLGLSISKKILDEHRGSSFQLRSREGKGTEVLIRMPLYRSEG